jgi:hypothetical protein
VRVGEPDHLGLQRVDQQLPSVSGSSSSPNQTATWPQMMVGRSPVSTTTI